MALRVLANTPKYKVTEEKLREELRRFGFPENWVFAIKVRGSKTWYRLAHTDSERKELEQRVKVNNKRYTVEAIILKLLKRYIRKSEATKIDCRLNLEKGWVTIYIRKPPTMSEENFRKVWESRDFKVEDSYGQVYGETEITLLSESTEREFEDAIKYCLKMKKQ